MTHSQVYLSLRSTRLLLLARSVCFLPPLRSPLLSVLICTLKFKAEHDLRLAYSQPDAGAIRGTSTVISISSHLTLWLIFCCALRVWLRATTRTIVNQRCAAQFAGHIVQ